MSEPELSREQAALFELIEGSNQHVFVTGRAGTGKSTLLRHLVAHSKKQMAVCAPTGVAALNVGGQTIHSLFKLPIGLIGRGAIDQYPATRTVLAAIDLLIIDEISMVGADLMDAIDRSLRQARGRRHEAFGGTQVVMFGDPYQLAPVPVRGEEAQYLRDHYRSPWFFDARVWTGEASADGMIDIGAYGAELVIRELGEIHRQRDDEFRMLLNAVRYGRVTADMADRLNDVGARIPDATADDPVVTLATRNDRVTAINAQYLEALPGRERVSVAEIAGDFGRGDAYPADADLRLKEGAQVMFLRNDVGNPDGPRWVNGTIGTVEHITPGSVRVLVDGDEFDVEPVVWERFRYAYDPFAGTLTRDVVAEFTQFPLRLAWAVTIHKSQGKTYDRAFIDLGSGAFAPGQTYVALSRLTSLDGLYLTRPLRPADIRVDPDVTRFMRDAWERSGGALRMAAS